jgi:hypothetical protein
MGEALMSERTRSIATENALPGTDQWRVTNPALNHEIEGYASSSVAASGQELTLYASTAAPSFTAVVFRMGWYDSLGARQMLSVELEGKLQSQPTIDSRRTVRANWDPSYSFIIPSDWLSGTYLVKLTSTQYADSGGNTIGPYDQYIFFVVDGSESDSGLLFQLSTFTYQAYNAWGSYSLYQGPGGDYATRAYAVSFDRPYQDGFGSAEFLQADYPLIRWLERNGFDVAYTASELVHEYPERLTSHRAFLSGTHDEYWSLNIRNGVESARDNGISVGFFGSNTCYWRVRTETDQESGSYVLVCYKDSAVDPVSDAPDTTVTWRDDPYPRPEDALIGQMYESDGSQFPHFAMVCQNTDHWIYAATGAQDGEAIPGIVGWEWDSVFRNDWPECTSQPSHSGPLPAGLEIIASSPVADDSGCQMISNVTIYAAGNGAWVFSAGTNCWSWGLDDLDPGPVVPWWVHNVSSPIIQGMTNNLLRKFLGVRSRRDLSYLLPVLMLRAGN